MNVQREGGAGDNSSAAMSNSSTYSQKTDGGFLGTHDLEVQPAQQGEEMRTKIVRGFRVAVSSRPNVPTKSWSDKHYRAETKTSGSHGVEDTTYKMSDLTISEPASSSRDDIVYQYKNNKAAFRAGISEELIVVNDMRRGFFELSFYKNLFSTTELAYSAIMGSFNSNSVPTLDEDKREEFLAKLNSEIKKYIDRKYPLGEKILISAMDDKIKITGAFVTRVNMINKRKKDLLCMKDKINRLLGSHGQLLVELGVELIEKDTISNLEDFNKVLEFELEHLYKLEEINERITDLEHGVYKYANMINSGHTANYKLLNELLKTIVIKSFFLTASTGMKVYDTAACAERLRLLGISREHWKKVLANSYNVKITTEPISSSGHDDEDSNTQHHQMSDTFEAYKLIQEINEVRKKCSEDEKSGQIVFYLPPDWGSGFFDGTLNEKEKNEVREAVFLIFYLIGCTIPNADELDVDELTAMRALVAAKTHGSNIEGKPNSPEWREAFSKFFSDFVFADKTHPLIDDLPHSSSSDVDMIHAEDTATETKGAKASAADVEWMDRKMTEQSRVRYEANRKQAITELTDRVFREAKSMGDNSLSWEEYLKIATIELDKKYGRSDTKCDLQTRQTHAKPLDEDRQPLSRQDDRRPFLKRVHAKQPVENQPRNVVFADKTHPHFNKDAFSSFFGGDNPFRTSALKKGAVPEQPKHAMHPLKDTATETKGGKATSAAETSSRNEMWSRDEMLMNLGRARFGGNRRAQEISDTALWAFAEQLCRGGDRLSIEELQDMVAIEWDKKYGRSDTKCDLQQTRQMHAKPLDEDRQPLSRQDDQLSLLKPRPAVKKQPVKKQRVKNQPSDKDSLDAAFNELENTNRECTTKYGELTTCRANIKLSDTYKKKKDEDYRAASEEHAVVFAECESARKSYRTAYKEERYIACGVRSCKDASEMLKAELKVALEKECQKRQKLNDDIKIFDKTVSEGKYAHLSLLKNKWEQEEEKYTQAQNKMAGKSFKALSKEHVTVSEKCESARKNYRTAYEDERDKEFGFDVKACRDEFERSAFALREEERRKQQKLNDDIDIFYKTVHEGRYAHLSLLKNKWKQKKIEVRQMQAKMSRMYGDITAAKKQLATAERDFITSLNKCKDKNAKHKSTFKAYPKPQFSRVKDDNTKLDEYKRLANNYDEAHKTYTALIGEIIDSAGTKYSVSGVESAFNKLKTAYGEYKVALE